MDNIPNMVLTHLPQANKTQEYSSTTRLHYEAIVDAYIDQRFLTKRSDSNFHSFRESLISSEMRADEWLAYIPAETLALLSDERQKVLREHLKHPSWKTKKFLSNLLQHIKLPPEHFSNLETVCQLRRYESLKDDLEWARQNQKDLRGAFQNFADHLREMGLGEKSLLALDQEARDVQHQAYNEAQNLLERINDLASWRCLDAHQHASMVRYSRQLDALVRKSDFAPTILGINPDEVVQTLKAFGINPLRVMPTIYVTCQEDSSFQPINSYKRVAGHCKSVAAVLSNTVNTVINVSNDVLRFAS